MTPLITVDAGRAEAAAAALNTALAGRVLITAERFTTAYRTCYTGPDPIEAMRPVLAVGCYRPWDPAQPEAAIAAEAITKTRSAGHRHTWLEQVFTPAGQALANLTAPPVLTGWYATPRLHTLAGPGGTVAAIDGALRARLEDKADFGHLLEQACVPRRARIRAVRIGGALPSMAVLRRRVGTSRVVVQAGVTSGGRGTVIAASDGDMAAAARLRGPYRVAAFIDGWSSNTTVLSVPDPHGGARIYVDRPSHKAIAVGELGVGAAKSAGNDWSRPWPAGAAALLAEAAVRIGEWAWREHRMAGLFGIDAILTPSGEVKVNEINCRNQGTTEVSAVNQQLRTLPPFIIAHLVTLLGGPVDWLGDADAFNHATLRCATTAGAGAFYAKVRLTGPAAASLSAQFAGPGVYRLDAHGRLRLARRGAHPAAADADCGELLIANTPGPDVTCWPGAEIATLEGITSGPGRPFSGPNTAAEHTLRFAAALRALFTPVPGMKETTP